MSWWGQARSWKAQGSWGGSSWGNGYQTGRWQVEKKPEARNDKAYRVCSCGSWMYDERIQKNGNVCHCGLCFPDPATEDGFDDEADTLGVSANARLLFRLGQVSWNEFG